MVAGTQANNNLNLIMNRCRDNAVIRDNFICHHKLSENNGYPI